MRVGKERDVRLGEENSEQLQTRIAAHLRQLISEGRIQPGARLLETQIAQAYNVSRSPARHALVILCRQRLVRPHAKRGYLVSGAARGEGIGRIATLEPTQITQSRQWELMYSQVEQQLFAAVLLGSVRINDQRMAEHFSVSRTVTRDLLARMHGIGLISKDRAGHWIAERVTPMHIRHLFEVRKYLEPQALLQAAPMLPVDVLRAMRERVALALTRSPVGSRDFDQIEVDLHVTVLGYAPNKEIIRALSRTQLLFGPTRHLNDPLLGIPSALIDDAVREHGRIVDHLLAGKPAAAARALHDHIDVAIERWLRRFHVAGQLSRLPLPPYFAHS